MPSLHYAEWTAQYWWTGISLVSSRRSMAHQGCWRTWLPWRFPLRCGAYPFPNLSSGPARFSPWVHVFYTLPRTAHTPGGSAALSKEPQNQALRNARTSARLAAACRLSACRETHHRLGHSLHSNRTDGNEPSQFSHSLSAHGRSHR